MKIILLIISLFLAGFAPGPRGVYLNEMKETPVLSLNDHKLTIQLTPSTRYKTLGIYELKATVNNEKREVYLTAKQAPDKEMISVFEIDLSHYKIQIPAKYAFLWRDPNKLAMTLAVKETK